MPKKQWAKAGKDNVRGVFYHTIQFPPSTVNGTPNNWKEWYMGHISTSVIAVARAHVPWHTAGFSISSPERGKMIASELAAIHYLKRQASDRRASSIHTFLSGHGVDLWAASVYTAAPCRAAYIRERKRLETAQGHCSATVSDDACLLMTFFKSLSTRPQHKMTSQKAGQSLQRFTISTSTDVIHLNQEK